MRSHYCGAITTTNLDQEVTICGWIHKRRDHGGVIFLDVRDIVAFGCCNKYSKS